MASKAKNAPKLSETPAAPATPAPGASTAAAKEEKKAPAYKASIATGALVTYRDHEGTDRPATVVYVNPPHKFRPMLSSGKPAEELALYPESVNLEVQGVAGGEKIRFPKKVLRGEEPGQFREA